MVAGAVTLAAARLSLTVNARECLPAFCLLLIAISLSSWYFAVTCAGVASPKVSWLKAVMAAFCDNSVTNLFASAIKAAWMFWRTIKLFS